MIAPEDTHTNRGKPRRFLQERTATKKQAMAAWEHIFLSQTQRENGSQISKTMTKTNVTIVPDQQAAANDTYYWIWN